MKTISVVLLTICAMACGYGSKYNPKTGNMGGAATISALSPTSATAGGSSFTLTVSASGLSTAAVIYWNGVAQSTANNGTIYVAPTKLTATISAAEIMTAGAVPVYVLQNAVKSNMVNFTVN